MRKTTFTDEELRIASASVLDSMLRSFPDLSACEHTFSDEFNAKMDALVRKMKARETMVSISKRIAAVFAASVIGFTTWIAVDADARAGFFEWIRETYVNSVVYKHFSEKEPNALPEYELAWLPDGFVEVLSETDEMGVVKYYVNPETGEAVGFEYRHLDKSSNFFVDSVNSTHVDETVEVQGHIAEYHPATLRSKTNNLIWIDESAEIIFVLNSNLDKAAIFNIAAHVELADSAD